MRKNSDHQIVFNNKKRFTHYSTPDTEKAALVNTLDPRGNPHPQRLHRFSITNSLDHERSWQKRLTSVVSFPVVKADGAHATLGCCSSHRSSQDSSIIQFQAEIILRNKFRKQYYKRLGEWGGGNPCMVAVLQKRCLHCHKSSVRPNLKTSPLRTE